MDELTQANDTVTPLSNETLRELSDAVLVPTYDRAALTPGIVHIGVGNFHRAHQAWYLHKLMQVGSAHDWAIVGAGVRTEDAKMRERLLAQDCLTSLIELRPDGRSAEVTGAMIGFLPVESDNAALIAEIAKPETRIVSLTVTEGGYYIHASSGAFDAAHPDMIHDAAHPNSPRSAFGAIVMALSRRRAIGTGPLTVQSCDNLQGNGEVTRRTVVGLARMIDAGLADWIDGTCSFPNSMVDCIVPATGNAEIAAARTFGINDSAPVTHENFRQWVIEDNFCAGRPDWDRVGAILTSRVHDYEAMKIRILNGGHQVLANAGELLSCDTIADCMADPRISSYFERVEREGIIPYVPSVPDMTPESYAVLIAQRFSNPAIRDTTRRVAFDGSSRHAGFILPIVRDALAAGGSVEGLALVEALWARMCAGTREDGTVIEPNDPNWTNLNKTALVARYQPSAWLAQSQIYGALKDCRLFTDSFQKWLSLIWSQGVSKSLSAYVSN
jgi:mannitol 2-dehydrogenase